MGYIENNLLPNEKVLLKANIHSAIFLSAVVELFVATIFFVVAVNSNPVDDFGWVWWLFALVSLVHAVVLGIKALIVVMTTEFGVTNRRIIAKKGFIRRHTLEMLLLQVESVSVEQSLIGRLMNFGIVRVIGTGGTKESFRAIVDPLKVRRVIHRMIEAQLAERSVLKIKRG